MSNPARPLIIAIISPDTEVVHRLSWMLTAVGYDIITSKDVGESASWRQLSEVDLVVFDGRSIFEPTQLTLAHRSDKPIYRLFLYDPLAGRDLTAWFATGANDALRVPLSRGELLARIRVGARFLEFENRMRSQSSRSRLPDMYSMRGLLSKLSSFTTEGHSVSLGHTLLTTAIDFFTGFCRAEGESAGRDLLAALATSIQQSVGGDALAAYVDDGTFQIVLPGQKPAAARIVADHIAQTFRAAQVDREPRPRLSLTTAIVPWQVGVQPEQLLAQGQETLAIAKQSGGDCTIDQDAFAQELANWKNEMTIGNPFANVTAQDIMESFPTVLDRDSPDPAMLDALRRSGVPVLPFVDREGRLVGVASPELTTDAAVLRPSTGGAQAPANPLTIAHDAAFSEIYDAFSTQGWVTMVVVADRRPVGYLTCGGFLSLVEPITSATYASDEPTLKDSYSLLVGSLVNEFALASGTDQ